MSRLTSTLRLDSWGACLLPLLAYAGINVAYAYFNRALIHCERSLFGAGRCTSMVDFNLAALPDTIKPGTPKAALAAAGRQVAEASARMYWMSAAILLIVLAIFVILLAAMWTKEALSETDTHVRIAGLIIMAVSVVLAVILSTTNARAFLLVDRVFAGGVIPQPSGEIGVAAAGWMRAVTFVSVAFLVVATASLLYRPVGEAETQEELAKRGQNLQWILYAGAATLIVALLEFRALFGWGAAAAVLNGKGTGPLVTTLADAAAASTGAIYALALAGLYLPALLVLRTRASRLYSPQPAPQNQSREAWLQENNLGFTMPKTIGTLVTVLSPLLAQAPIAALLKLLG